jgi:hypothetical protein
MSLVAEWSTNQFQTSDYSHGTIQTDRAVVNKKT